MMTNPIYRQARHLGRMAVVTHRLQGGEAPECPFRPGTRRGFYWQWGAEDADRIVGQLLEYAPRHA